MKKKLLPFPDEDGKRRLEEGWKLLEEHYPQETFQNNMHESFADKPLEGLAVSIMTGYYPSPDLLFLILEKYLTYHGNAGSISLEEVFYGKPKKGVGNYAARHTKDKEYLKYYLYLTATSSNKSLLEKTEDYINDNNLNIEPESLLRKYRRLSKSYRGSDN